MQGGFLSTPVDTYRLWNDTTISYLCYSQFNKPTCTNRLLTSGMMEEQLEKAITFEVQKCLDLGEFESWTFDVEANQQPAIDVTIREQEVLVNMKYPITLKSDQAQVTQEEFRAIIKKPLGDVYQVSQDILDFETEFGEFDQLIYMLGHKGRYKIYKLRPYPDKLYRIKRSDSNYMFQFFVQGAPAQ